MIRHRLHPLVAGLVAVVVGSIAAAAPEASPAETTELGAGIEAAAAGDFTSALDRLEAAAAAAPDDLRPGAEYRQVAIRAGAYDRAIDFFARLAERHPDSAAVQLNWGYAYVDKIPDAGAVTQVILADRALGRFSRAIEIEPTWLALYTRGNSLVYWPAIFGRTGRAIADLERAIELASNLPWSAYHARAWASLGDAHWRLGDLERAHEVWRQGLERYPGDPGLSARLDRRGERLDLLLEEHYAIGQRVETHLRELWEG